jgi:hypothetical protein
MNDDEKGPDPTRHGASRQAIRSAPFVLLALLVASLTTCERAGDEETRRRGPPVSSSSEALPGLVIGQVVTRTDVVARLPIEGVSDADAEVGRRFRRAVRDLEMFHEENGPGPTVDFSLTFAVGLGSDEPPPPEAPPGGSGSVGSEDSETEVDYAVLVLEARGVSDDEGQHVEIEVQGIYRERVGPDETPTEAAWRLVDDGIADIVEGIRAEAAPRCADDNALIEMLDRDDPDELLPAIREVHRRRLQAAAPALRQLLRPEPADVTLAAAAALGHLRDAEAVGPLIDLISRERREMTMFILPILGEINSREARLYLETVADAHASPQVRAQAREILDETSESP